MRIIEGIIQSFGVATELNRVSMTGNISVIQALEVRQVCTGDGCGYTFNTKDLQFLQEYLRKQLKETIPIVNARRPYDDKPTLYQESDRCFVLNNYDMCLWALDNHRELKQIMEGF